MLQVTTENNQALDKRLNVDRY